VFDELVALVDPGTEPYKPTKGKVNVLMAVGIQASYDLYKRTHADIPGRRVLGRQRRARRWVFRPSRKVLAQWLILDS